MRHGKKINHLTRKSSHRKAMLSNLANSLITHKRIKTTLPKAKALRKWVEPIITRAKYDNTHSRRMVFSDLGDKEAVKELFITVADKIGDRPGGYTRIIKLGSRLGDNAEMAMIELVDFNENLLEEKSKSGRKSKRRRRGGSKKSAEQKQSGGEESASGSQDQGVESLESDTSTSTEDQEEGGETTEQKADASEYQKNQATDESKDEEQSADESKSEDEQDSNEASNEQNEGGDESDTKKE